MHEETKVSQSVSRREFIKKSSTVTGAIAVNQFLSRSAHVLGSDTLRIGLIGCGSRGTGAATQALSADPNVKLVAMGDAFEDRLQLSLKSLLEIQEVAPKVDVPADRRFVGFQAYQEVIDSGVDVVLLAEPPHFRPRHLRAAIDAGKHVFAEKPVAVDAPGVRSVLATCEDAHKKGLAVVSGLCLRYSYGFREMVRRLHDGAAGEIRALQANDYRGPIWVKPRRPEWTDMDWQMRNWYYFTWLSGDFNVEQHVHYLDVCAWIMNGKHPVKAFGMGGRQIRTGPEYGNIFDHHSVIYEYADGARLYSNCRQMPGCHSDISASVIGSRGTAEISDRKLRIHGDRDWEYQGEKNNFYQTEHDELFASIRQGKPINNGEYMATSTLLAIMGRMATYTGQLVTWDQAFNSAEDLTPARYEWGSIPTPQVAVPGVTKLV